MGFEDIYNTKEEDEGHTVSTKSDVSVISPQQNTVRLWNLFVAVTSLVAVTVSLFEVVKKLSGEGTAEWFTSIANEMSQVVTFVLTCEESAAKLKPMCDGVMVLSYPQNRHTFYKIIFFSTTTGGRRHGGAFGHLPLDASVRLSHSYREPLQVRCVQVRRGRSSDGLQPGRPGPADQGSESEGPGGSGVSHRRGHDPPPRVQGAAQATFNLVHTAIEELEGPAGLDQSGVSPFTSPGAIDLKWAAQQRHLECLQDPPDVAMYRVARSTSINGVNVPYYKSPLRSSSAWALKAA